MPAHRDPDQFAEQVTAYAETYGIHLTAAQRDLLRALATGAPLQVAHRPHQPGAHTQPASGVRGHTVTRIVLDETITWPGTEG